MKDERNFISQLIMDNLTIDDLQKINYLVDRYSITATQAIHLYQHSSQDLDRIEKALLDAKLEGEEIYHGAYKRLNTDI